MKAIGAHLLVQTGQSFSGDPLTVTVTTAQSFKGYDAEIAVVAGVDQFVAKEKGILANSLYVAMTRARSILALYGRRSQKADQNRILTVLEECLDELVDHPRVEKQISSIDEFEEVVQRVGTEHRGWLERIWKSHWIEQEPILAADGEILAEPLFWFKNDERHLRCFGKHALGRSILNRLEDAGIEVVLPGEEPARGQ